MKKRLYKLLLTSILLLPLMFQNIQADNQISTKPLYFYSDNYLLMDADDGTVLFEKNGYELVHPASITKVLTAITAIEMMESKNMKLTDLVTLGDEVFNGFSSIATVAGFKRNETLTLNDILHGIILPSGADATRAMSYHLTGDPEGLTEHMNVLAQKINMTKTHFVNTSGLDHEDHLTTPYDLALLIKYALKNETFKKLYSTERYTTSQTTENPEGINLKNGALVFAHEQGMMDLIGTKAGYTEMGERTLSSFAQKDGKTLIFISTNAPLEDKIGTNILDAINVYNYVFSSFNRETILAESQEIGTLPIRDAKTDFKVTIDRNISYYLPKDVSIHDLSIQIEPASETLVAPIKANSILGKVSVKLGDTVLHEEDIITGQKIPVKFTTRLWRGFIFALKAVLVILFIGILAILGIRYYNLNKIRKRKMNRKRTINR